MEDVDAMTQRQRVSPGSGRGKPATHRVLAQVLRNLEDQADLVALDLERVENGGQRALLKADVDDGTNDGHNLALHLGVRRKAGCVGGGGRTRRGVVSTKARGGQRWNAAPARSRTGRVVPGSLFPFSLQIGDVATYSQGQRGPRGRPPSARAWRDAPRGASPEPEHG